jgi:group II intron reverse transcriptase/maturase
VKAENLRNESYRKEGVVYPHGPAEVFSAQAIGTEDRISQIHYNNLMEKVVENGNVKQALRRVELNNGAPGIDGMQVKDLRIYLRKNWPVIKEQLLNGTYKPVPVRRVEIPKLDGGVRLLGIPTALDRFIQQAILLVLTPIYEPTFSDHSYGFRPNRNTRQAVKRAKQYINEGKKIVVDIDLEKFFDKVNHDKLMGLIRQKIADNRLNKLIVRYLKAGIMLNGCCVASEDGVPQGGPLSPLLANIMLNELDEELTRRGHHFVRYADDCNLYVKSKRAGDRVMESVIRFLEKQLKLKVNAAKSAVAQPWERKFLGFSFTSEEEVRVRIAPRSIERFKERIRQLTTRNCGISLEERINKLNEYLTGWMGYFGFIETPSIFKKLEGWLHRKMRTCLLKHWKNPRTIQRNLVALGLSQEWASNIGESGRGWWRLAKTRQMHAACGKRFWMIQGLVSLVERYNGIVHA